MNYNLFLMNYLKYNRMSKINEIKKELGLSQNDIAKFFGYKDGGSYARSSRKNHVDNGIIQIYKLTKQKIENNEPTE